MSAINKATPRAILQGIQDLSRRALVAENEQNPQHMPHIYLLAERGPTIPQVAIGDSFTQLYGSSTLDLRSKYVTHATVLAETVMANGNQCMIQRVKPPLAATAMLRLSVEVIPAQITIYQRNSDGTLQVDALGNPIPATSIVGGNTPTKTTITTTGHRVVWHASLAPYTGDGATFGNGNIISQFRKGTTLAGPDMLSSLTTPSGAAAAAVFYSNVATSGSGQLSVPPVVLSNGQIVTLTGQTGQNDPLNGDYVYNATYTLTPYTGNTSSVATETNNVALTGVGPLLIGGVAYDDGAIIHLSGQTVVAQNGLYTYNASYTLTPAPDSSELGTVTTALEQVGTGSLAGGNANGLVIAGFTLNNGDIVALEGQANPSQNGDYTYHFNSGSYTLTAGGTLTSTLYPILDLNVSSFGDYGNRVGITIDTPNAVSVPGGNVSTMDAVGAFLYRIGCVERPATLVTPNTTETVGGEQFLDVTLKENVNDPLTGNPLSIVDTFLAAWESLNDPTVPPLYGPFSQLNLYRENLATVLGLLINGGTEQGISTVGEAAYDADAAAYGRTPNLAFTGKPNNTHLLNIFTGVDQNGVPYWSFDVSNSVRFGGVAFGAGNYHYATGGDDGLPVDVNGQPDALATLALFDDAVANQLQNWGNLEAQMLDEAKYPVSTYWDTGFSQATKPSLLVPMSKRRDIWSALATQSLGEYNGAIYSGTGTAVEVDGIYLNDRVTVTINNTMTDIIAGTHIYIAPGALTGVPSGYYKVSIIDPTISSQPNYTLQAFAKQAANTQSQDSAYALALRTAAANYPESQIYGTPACRAIIVGRAGKLINSQYRDILPLTIDVADKVSRYMGAGNGAWVNGQAFDVSPANQVRLFRDVNVTWEPDASYNSDWDNGLVWVQNFDRRSQFYPAFQTVYPDDTSVLNSLVTVIACCELEKVVQEVWRSLTGISNLTQAQFVAESNKRINDAVKDRFDGRFVIVPNTFFTEADKARGYSYSCKVNIYANNMISVGSMTIVANRMSDLTTTTA